MCVFVGFHMKYFIILRAVSGVWGRRRQWTLLRSERTSTAEFHCDFAILQITMTRWLKLKINMRCVCFVNGFCGL